MPWNDVCTPGRWVGGRVRQDDVARGASAADHDAGGPSPGILQFVQEVIRTSPQSNNDPPKPDDFPTTCRVDTYPGRGAADVHFEGRAADVFLDYSSQRAHGDWLFDSCVQNCEYYKIQGVIWGPRQWFSETRGGTPSNRPQRDHYNHVHVELNCDGANQAYYNVG
jgi:hypothetical protein